LELKNYDWNKVQNISISPAEHFIFIEVKRLTRQPKSNDVDNTDMSNSELKMK